MESLPTLGAPFLRTFLESSSKAKMELISKYGGTRSGNLGDALETSHPGGRLFNIARNPELSADPIIFKGDSISRPNQALIWAKENNPMDEFYRLSDSELRALGYVFWDSHRLQKMRSMKEPRAEMGWSTPPDTWASQRCQNPSAEERLKDMGFVLSIPNRRTLRLFPRQNVNLRTIGRELNLNLM